MKRTFKIDETEFAVDEHKYTLRMVDVQDTFQNSYGLPLMSLSDIVRLRKTIEEFTDKIILES